MNRKLLLAVPTAFLALFAGATAAPCAMDVYGSISSYNWREYGSDFKTDEKGALFGAGVAGSYVAPAPSVLALRGKVEAFGGEMDYDSTTGGFNEESSVAGFNIEGTIGLHARLGGGLSLEPLAGFGYRYWMREFDSFDIEEERWQNVYGKAGLRLEQRFPGTPVTAFAEGGARISIKTWTTYDLGIGDLTVYPKNRTTTYVEGGVKVNRVRFTVFYENLRFGASNPVAFTDGVDTFEARQPKTEADIIGLRVGAVF